MPCLSDATDEIARIKKEFPGWYPWRSSACRWWACRAGDVHWWDQPRDPDWAMCVDADTEEGLRCELAQQCKLDLKAADDKARPNPRQERA
jgi:hypothetical protein